MPVCSSDFTSENLLASAVSWAAKDSAPTRVARKAPTPATTKLPDITSEPASFSMGSDSPVSSDSSTSR